MSSLLPPYRGLDRPFAGSGVPYFDRHILPARAIAQINFAARCRSATAANACGSKKHRCYVLKRRTTGPLVLS
jgi:hypothetical protein